MSLGARAARRAASRRRRGPRSHGWRRRCRRPRRSRRRSRARRRARRGAQTQDGRLPAAVRCGAELAASDHASCRPLLLPVSRSTEGPERCDGVAAAAPGASRCSPRKLYADASPTMMRCSGALAVRSHTQSVWSTEPETATATCSCCSGKLSHSSATAVTGPWCASANTVGRAGVGPDSQNARVPSRRPTLAAASALTTSAVRADGGEAW